VTDIVTTAVRDLARAVGGFATEVFEIRESARRAAADAESSGASSEESPGEEPPTAD
jgi:hypothetical protein